MIFILKLCKLLCIEKTILFLIYLTIKNISQAIIKLDTSCKICLFHTDKGNLDELNLKKFLGFLSLEGREEYYSSNIEAESLTRSISPF